MRNVAQRGNFRHMNGTDLKVRRITAHIKAKDLAAVAQWTTSKVSRIENRAHVEPDDVETYVAALATLTTTTTEGTAA